MTKPSAKFHSLSRRIVVYFCVFTLAISAVFSLISFLLMYTLEDAFIVRDMQLEADYLVNTHQATGQWPAPRKPNMSLHFSKQTFPDDIRTLALEEPSRHEFYGGEGRHYHLYTLPEQTDWYLVAEVSADLLVRPIRGGVMQFLAFSGIVVSIVACLIAWLVARKTTRPLKALASLVGDVEPEQIPKRFAEDYPNNEIGILAKALERSFTRIADALAREKCFTHDVSHELRSPLAVISNGAELVLSQDALNSSQTQALKRIQDAAEQMEKTVSTLLMLARESHLSTPKVQVDLMAVVERSVIDHSRILEGKSVDVEISETCNTDLIIQDGMLKVLLDNLLSNAFQYTDAGVVMVEYTDGRLVVSDTGPGIDPAISDTVTSPAVKGQKSTGFGFGLSIVSRLCEHQGWALNVTSDKGTKIVVTLD